MKWNNDSVLFIWKVTSKIRFLLSWDFKAHTIWLNRLQGKQWSVIQRGSEYVTVTLDTDQERINVPCIQTYRWKEKLAVCWSTLLDSISAHIQLWTVNGDQGIHSRIDKCHGHLSSHHDSGVTDWKQRGRFFKKIQDWLLKPERIGKSKILLIITHSYTSESVWRKQNPDRLSQGSF